MGTKDTAGWLPGYRGYVDHGVETPDYEEVDDGYSNTPGLTEFAAADPETPPIAVKIVSDEKPRTRKEWRLSKYLLRPNAGAVMVAGLNPNRTSLVLNVGADVPMYSTCFVGSDATVNRMTGLDLSISRPFTISAVTEVWVVLVNFDDGTTVATPDPVEITCLTEYEVEL